MDALTAIGTRISASKLGPPGPSPEELGIILKMGMRAPDHGRLSPWRFVVIEGDARAKFGEAMADIRRAGERRMRRLSSFSFVRHSREGGNPDLKPHRRRHDSFPRYRAY
jgi:nitroreductase